MIHYYLTTYLKIALYVAILAALAIFFLVFGV